MLYHEYLNSKINVINMFDIQRRSILVILISGTVKFVVLS